MIFTLSTQGNNHHPFKHKHHTYLCSTYYTDLSHLTGPLRFFDLVPSSTLKIPPADIRHHPSPCFSTGAKQNFCFSSPLVAQPLLKYQPSLQFQSPLAGNLWLFRPLPLEWRRKACSKMAKATSIENSQSAFGIGNSKSDKTRIFLNSPTRPAEDFEWSMISSMSSWWWAERV